MRAVATIFTFAILLGITSGGGVLFAQLPDYHAQVFGAEQGLDAGDISMVLQDKQQFLWVVSDGTVQRFDGRNVYKYTFDHYVSQALCDGGNRIWVLSGQKIWRSCTDRWGFVEVPFDTLSRSAPHFLFLQKGLPLCAVTAKGFFTWNEKAGDFQAFQTPLPPALLKPAMNHFDTCGTTIFYPGKGVYFAADVATGVVRTIPRPRLFKTFCALTPDLAVISYYDGRSELLDFIKGKATLMDAVAYGLSDRERRLLLMDAQPLGDSLFLVTTRFGACTYDLRRDRLERHRIFAEGKPIDLEEGLIQLFRDDSGTYWGHNTSNVIAFNSMQQSIGLLRNYLTDPAQRWSNHVIGFAEDRAGNIWFGGFNGFNMLDSKTGQVQIHPPNDNVPNRLSHISVRGMAYDGRYIILGPTDKGIWLYEPATDRFRRPKHASDSVRAAINREFINGFYPLKNGDVLVCARYHTYLLEKNTYNLDFVKLPNAGGSSTGACEDTFGRIWVAYSKGVAVFDAGYQFLFNLDPGEDQVLTLYQRSDGELLAGTKKGLRLLAPLSEKAVLTKVPGPLDNTTVSVIHRDDRNRFWFGTDKGLFLLDSALAGFRHFDYADNIQNERYYLFSKYKARNGLLFLGGKNGINYFYPENIELEARPLVLTLQKLTIGDGDSVVWNPGMQFLFPHNQNTLTFEVVAPYFNNAGKLQYRYRIKPRGPWIGTEGSPVIRLAELPHGDYRLEVEVRVDGAKWYPAAPLNFRIRPAFWQQPLFFVAVFLALLLMVYSIVRYRERLIRERQRQSLELEKLKSTALQYELEMEQVINYFNHAIAQTSTVEEALWDVAHQCIARLGLEDCVIYLIDQDKGMLRQTAAWGEKSSPEGAIVAPLEIPVGEGIVGAVAKSGKPEIVSDTINDPRYIPDDVVRRSELAVPIFDGDRVVGVIDSEHSQKDYFTAWHLQLFTAIASLCSNKIALARSEEARKQALLETVNSKRKAAEAKLESLRLQMNPHFLFNALNSIQELILTGNSFGASLYLSKFSKLLRKVLTHSDKDFLSLREELDILQLYLELEALRFFDSFDFKVETEPGLDLDEYKLPTLLIQPFVENAIWHGLMHKEGNRKLLVRFETNKDDNLVCIVEDNGIGRLLAKKAPGNGLHTGKGMRSSVERLQTLNIRHNRQYRLDISDLIAADGKPAGTRVCITFS